MKKLIALLLASSLAACGESSSVKTGGHSQGEATVKHTVTQTLESIGKQSAGVSLKHTMPSKIIPGDVVAIELAFGGLVAGESLDVTVQPEGVELVNGGGQHRLQMTDAGVQSLSLSAYCAEAGRYYINLVVARTGAGGDVRRQAFSIPVQVGDAVVQKVNDKNIQRDADGKDIHSLPASETILEDKGEK